MLRCDAELKSKWGTIVPLLTKGKQVLTDFTLKTFKTLKTFSTKQKRLLLKQSFFVSSRTLLLHRIRLELKLHFVFSLLRIEGIALVIRIVLVCTKPRDLEGA